MEDLVQTVKEMQRNDQVAKEQWWAYCDALGQGIRDPAKHNDEFVQSFIDNYRAGNRFEPNVPTATAGGGGGNSGGNGGLLSQLCKEGQRKSHSWKETWAQYCLHYGGGKNDPEKHDTNFIVGFLDHVSARGLVGLSAMGAGAVPDYGPSKRMRATNAANPYTAPGAKTDAQKDALVQRIKSYQRSSPDAKEVWGQYCDEHLGGVRDPNRHDRAVLQAFASKHDLA